MTLYTSKACVCSCERCGPLSKHDCGKPACQQALPPDVEKQIRENCERKGISSREVLEYYRLVYNPPTKEACSVPQGQTHPTCNDCFEAGRGHERAQSTQVAWSSVELLDAIREFLQAHDEPCDVATISMREMNAIDALRTIVARSEKAVKT